jgi:hypothetical protein
MGFWENLIVGWIAILDRWAEEMGKSEPVHGEDRALTGTDRIDKTLSTSGADLVPGGPDMTADIPATRPEVGDDEPPPHERQPVGLRAARVIKTTLTRTTRRDLGRAMLDMTGPGGWRSSALNPDMPDPRKFAILSDRFDKIALTDEGTVLYRELLALAAVAAGWAQGIQRRHWRDVKRARRAQRRERRARRRGDHVREPGTVPGLARGHGDVDP